MEFRRPSEDEIRAMYARDHVGVLHVPRALDVSSLVRVRNAVRGYEHIPIEVRKEIPRQYVHGYRLREVRKDEIMRDVLDAFESLAQYVADVMDYEALFDPKRTGMVSMHYPPGHAGIPAHQDSRGERNLRLILDLSGIAPFRAGHSVTSTDGVRTIDDATEFDTAAGDLILMRAALDHKQVKEWKACRPYHEVQTKGIERYSLAHGQKDFVRLIGFG